MFYIALAFWLVTLIFSLSEGQRKLPLLSFTMGLTTIWLIYSSSHAVTGVAILTALAVIVYLGGKVNAPAASR